MKTKAGTVILLDDYQVSSEEHASRMFYHKHFGEILTKSINDFLKNVASTTSNSDCCGFFETTKKHYVCENAMVRFPKNLTLASDPRWCARQFGAANTVEKAACGVFVAKNILDYFGAEVNFMDVLEEAENKGYRIWKFENSKKTFSSIKPTLREAKKAFPDNSEVQNAKAFSEVYPSITGKVTGVGCSMFLIDNIILKLAALNGYWPTPIADTRIATVAEIFTNLQNGIPVPVRINNAVYLDDPEKSEGHYVVLYGVDTKTNTATVFDSSMPDGHYVLPLDRLFRAMIANPGMVCAWDLSVALI